MTKNKVRAGKKEIQLLQAVKNKVSIAKLQGSDGAKVLCYGLD